MPELPGRPEFTVGFEASQGLANWNDGAGWFQLAFVVKSATYTLSAYGKKCLVETAERVSDTMLVDKLLRNCYGDIDFNNTLQTMQITVRGKGSTELQYNSITGPSRKQTKTSSDVTLTAKQL